MPGTDTCQVFHAHGLRCTRGQKRVFEILKSARGPLTHAQILARLRGTGLNRVTIYRGLESFVRVGLVHRAYIRERTWAFETADRCKEDRCHPHFTCRDCGAVACMTDVTVPLATGLPKGYIAKRQQVHIEGICASCAARERRKVRKR